MSSGPWEIRLSRSRKAPYFFNRETQASVWERPEEITGEEAKLLPGSEFLDRSKVRASHLLVKHSGSRRPSSWKETNITRSKDEAIALLETYAAEIGLGDAPDTAKFAELAAVHSDDSSHTNGGDLGSFGRGQMQKPFEDAAFGLEVGKMSGIVETDSGVHLILRTA